LIVVSDTTPLNYLVLIGAVDVLPRLFKNVYAPSAVVHELTHPKAPPAVCAWAQSPPSWLTISAPVSRLASTAQLDLGEAQAISLAKELNIPAILIDERLGSTIARREGLVPLPTLAILERAAEKNLIDLPTFLTKLLQTNFRVPAAHIRAALLRDAARKPRH